MRIFASECVISANPSSFSIQTWFVRFLKWHLLSFHRPCRCCRYQVSWKLRSHQLKSRHALNLMNATICGTTTTTEFWRLMEIILLESTKMQGQKQPSRMLNRSHGHPGSEEDPGPVRTVPSVSLRDPLSRRLAEVSSTSQASGSIQVSLPKSLLDQ